jgi:hypothetical protein
VTIIIHLAANYFVLMRNIEKNRLSEQVRAYCLTTSAGKRAENVPSLGESIPVPPVILDWYWRGVAESGRRLVLVKMDIEGAGSTALTHCGNNAESQRCFFLIESHSCDEDAAIGVLARSERFDPYRVSDARWVSQQAATNPNPNGIWSTLLLVPREHTAEVRRLLS